MFLVLAAQYESLTPLLDCLGEGGGGGEVGRNYLHAQDYMVYAHLQLSRDEEARDFMDDMASASAPTMRWQPPPCALWSSGATHGKDAIQRFV